MQGGEKLLRSYSTPQKSFLAFPIPPTRQPAYFTRSFGGTVARHSNVEKPLCSDGLDIGMSSYDTATDCLHFVRRVKHAG